MKECIYGSNILYVCIYWAPPGSEHHRAAGVFVCVRVCVTGNKSYWTMWDLLQSKPALGHTVWLQRKVDNFCMHQPLSHTSAHSFCTTAVAAILLSLPERKIHPAFRCCISRCREFYFFHAVLRAPSCCHSPDPVFPPH